VLIVQTITESEQALLKLLLKNSRLSTSAIGNKMGKGRNWVARTIKRLVRNKIIRAYITVLDPVQVYAERSTILFIKTNPRELGVSQALLNMSELESLDGISGEYSLLGFFRFEGSSAFEDYLNSIDQAIAKSGAQTYNLVQVLSTYKTHGFTLEKSLTRGQLVSEKEWELMKVIHRQAPTEENPFPISQGEIGKRMSPPLSQPTVSKAMQRFQEQSTIIGYSVDIHFKHIELPIKFFLQIKVKAGTITTTASRISKMIEIWDLHRTSEEYSLFATVRTQNIEHYNSFMRQLYKDDNILDTHSEISLEEWFVPV
jgi:DNA-binding Lrp family transcriptional regulator